MNNELDFIFESKVPPELISKYKSVLPEQIIRLWIDLGFGTLRNGYLKIVDSEVYAPLLEEAYQPVHKNAIVLFATALSDLIVWEGGYLILINLRHGISKVIESGFKYFLTDILEDDFIREELAGNAFFLAKDIVGETGYWECYGYFPLLGLGGAEKVANLQKVKIKEHISIISQSMGKIK